MSFSSVQYLIIIRPIGHSPRSNMSFHPSKYVILLRPICLPPSCNISFTSVQYVTLPRPICHYPPSNMSLSSVNMSLSYDLYVTLLRPMSLSDGYKFWTQRVKNKQIVVKLYALGHRTLGRIFKVLDRMMVYNDVLNDKGYVSTGTYMRIRIPSNI